MIIKVLAENTAIREEFGAEHGLSFSIETSMHKLLFDMGASSLFAENAKRLDVDLAEVDLAILSHGHYDHGGGLRTFLEHNQVAPVYVHREAFGWHYSQRDNGELKYIGLDQSLADNPRLAFVGEHIVLDEELELFAGVKGERLLPTGNQSLFRLLDHTYEADPFRHEQNLIIREDDMSVLIAGCAHRGIVNILERFRELKGSYPNYVLGGFHLYSHSKRRTEEPEVLHELAEYLRQTAAGFYTCHCTGEDAYTQLKRLLGERISYVSAGSALQIGRTK